MSTQSTGTRSFRIRHATFGAAFVRWFAMLVPLSVELIGFRYRRSPMSALISIGEPVLVVFFFTLVHSLSGIQRPPYGQSTTVFYLSGIVPFYLFFQSSLRFRLWDSLPRFPQLSEADLFTTQLLSEIFGKGAIILICSAGIYIFYPTNDVWPAHPLRCIEALLIIGIFGACLGIVNAVVAGFFFVWTYLYAVLMRAWMAFSGVLFLVDHMPDKMRTAASWIPITHAIILYRSGQYPSYPSLVLDMSYLIKSTIVIIAVAWISETGTRRWRSFR